MKDLLNEIVDKIKNTYGGYLDCKAQNADMYVYIDGNEIEIESICTESVFFVDDYYSCLLIDCDIQHLVYINHCI
jgi:hypothetical protein